MPRLALRRSVFLVPLKRILWLVHVEGEPGEAPAESDMLAVYFVAKAFKLLCVL